MSLEPGDADPFQPGRVDGVWNVLVQGFQSGSKARTERAAPDQGGGGVVVVHGADDEQGLHGRAGEDVVGAVQVVEQGGRQQVLRLEAVEDLVNVDSELLDVGEVERRGAGLAAAAAASEAAGGAGGGDLAGGGEEDVDEVRGGADLAAQRRQVPDLLGLGGGGFGEGADAVLYLCIAH